MSVDVAGNGLLLMQRDESSRSGGSVTLSASWFHISLWKKQSCDLRMWLVFVSCVVVQSSWHLEASSVSLSLVTFFPFLNGTH